MRRNPTADLSTLRSRAKDLLPTTTVLLYGQDDTLLKKSLQSIRRQQHVTLDCILLTDDPHYEPGQLPLKHWPERFALRHLKPDFPCGKSRLVNLALPHISSRHVLVLQAGDRFERDEIALMEKKLALAPPHTAAVFGNLELWESSPQGDRITKALPSIMTRSMRRLLNHLKREHRLAPPLLPAKLLKRIGYPTDYPGEGFLLADTAFTLALLQEGTLEHHADLCIRRYTNTELACFQKEDEKRILHVLLRQSAKDLSLPEPYD
ncbi:hypothetical protein CIG75_07505 [Tumebacillus algifaecis]|uniref:Uncharacterized protein n=1 Tax=Tumebacillus algifaecis TaxID=1214604 RepID=A0A223CZE8_9BACL|nr:glycosyltransferase family 2 protein [Tumebacillus algifaecis]ASS74839.1 hypothetical protein CIG75_07505 [Tumebacillus algifaecis]